MAHEVLGIGRRRLRAVREEFDVLVVVEFEEGDGGAGCVGRFAVVREVEAEEVMPEGEGFRHVRDVVRDVRDAGRCGERVGAGVWARRGEVARRAARAKRTE